MIVERLAGASHRWPQVDDRDIDRVFGAGVQALLAVGRKVKAGESCAVVESVKTASDIYAPVSGEVMANNPELAQHPDLVNSAPYGNGWFFKIKLADPAELSRLLSPEDYLKQITP